VRPKKPTPATKNPPHPTEKRHPQKKTGIRKKIEHPQKIGTPNRKKGIRKNPNTRKKRKKRQPR